MKKLCSLALTLLMALTLCVPAMAQTVGTESTTATITISNAAKGETYSIYKLFDATVDGKGAINYTGDIPESLKDYFTADTAGNITATSAALKEGSKDVMSGELQAALKTWAGTQTATKSVESDGSVLKFAGLAYGYYVITTSQGNQTITVDSTNPNAEVVDKNSTTPGSLEKKVNNDNVNIGDTVTYTVKFKTSNYAGAGESAKQITEYVITDTLPDFLTNVTVTNIIIDNDGSDTTTDDQTTLTVQQFDDNKKITIDWVDDNNTSLYKNGAYVILTYTAVVTDEAAIAGNGNKNTVTVTWNTKEGQGGKEEASEEIFTYGFALKKVNEKGEALAGAKFQLPFYVKETADTDGAYIYAGTTAGEGLTNELTTPESGEITIKGVEGNKEYSITEAIAPDGYNKLTEAVKVVPTLLTTTETDVTKYLDKDGNVTNETTDVSVTYANNKLAVTPVFVVNKAGIELPSTGGMGTTIFYTVGGILMAGAVILLITKKKMSAEEK